MWQLLFAAGLFLVCALDSAAADSEGPVYVEVGGTAVLHPGSTVSGNINSVTWKHGADKAAELYEGMIVFYGQFKDRCELNTTTGELTIKDLTLSDSGFYSAEINLNKVNTVHLWVMCKWRKQSLPESDLNPDEASSCLSLSPSAPVPKPLVSTWCDPTKTYCLLTCEGNTSVPESVKYRWNKGDVYSISSKVLNITKENEEPEFSCEMKNPVSSRRSDPVQNPLITGNSSGIIIAVVVSILLVVIVAVAVIVVYCRRQGTWTAPQDRVPHPPGNLWSRLRDLLPGSRTTDPVDNKPETTELLLKPENSAHQEVSNGGVHSLPPDDGSSPVVSSSAASPGTVDVHPEPAQDPGAAESSASNTDTVAVKMEVSTEDCGVSAESSKEAGAGAEQTLKETEDLVPEGRGVEPASSGAGLSVTVQVHPEPAQDPGAAGSSASGTGSGESSTGKKAAAGDGVPHPLGKLWSRVRDFFLGSKSTNPQVPVVQPVTYRPGRAADEEEAGETMELLSDPGGDQQESSSDLHSPPDDGSPPVASSSGEDNLSTEKASGFSETSDQDQDQDQDLTCSPEITKNTTEENLNGP